jgi:D-mannonate dehydratase
MRLATHFGVVGEDINKTIDYCHALDIKYLCSGHWTDNLPAFKEQLAKEGITLAMMEMGWLGEDMLFGDAPKKSELQGFIDKVKQIGDAGIEMGGVFCALKTSGNLDEEWKRITDFYHEIGNHAEKNNVKIANHFGWGPEYIIKDQATFKKLLDAVPNQYIGINLCLGCLQIVSPEDINQHLDETLDIIGSRLFLVHIRDIKVDGKNWADRAMGQGEIPLGVIVDRLCSAYREKHIKPIVLPEHMPKAPGEQANEISATWALGYVSGMVKEWDWLKP